MSSRDWLIRREKCVERSPATMRHLTRFEESALVMSSKNHQGTTPKAIVWCFQQMYQHVLDFWWYEIWKCTNFYKMWLNLMINFNEGSADQCDSCRFHSYGISPRLNKLLNAAWLKFRGVNDQKGHVFARSTFEHVLNIIWLMNFKYDHVPAMRIYIFLDTTGMTSLW